MSPRSKRDDLKRMVAQIVNHQAKAIVTIAELQAIFAEHEPDMAQYLEQCALNENATRDAMLAFAMNSWMLEDEALASFL